jgi:hypothetical protein
VSGYRAGIFKCPFYSRDYRDYLNCEGAQVKLPKEELDEYTRRYCANEEWRRCPIARALTLHLERPKVNPLLGQYEIHQRVDEKNVMHIAVGLRDDPCDHNGAKEAEE